MDDLTTEGQPSDDLLNGDRLLTPNEAAPYFRVDGKTMSRWAAAGRVPNLPDGRRGVIETPGGHRRFRASVIKALVDGTLTWKEVPGDGHEDR